jgi:autotransporter-associated beta strand protein
MPPQFLSTARAELLRVAGPVNMKLIALLLGIIAATPAGADQVKANNDTGLELGGSWVSGVAPGSGDNAIWNSTVATAANTLNSNVSWLGIVISNPSAPVVITGTTTLTNGANGINMGGASVNLTINCGTLSLGANQTWTVASDLTLTTGSATSSGSVNSPNNGNYVITKAGGGVWTTSGTSDNGSIGLVIDAGTVNLNKTSNSGTHAVGGPGLTVNNGGTARITGAGGDQIYDGAAVTLAPGGTFDLNGNSEGIAELAGSGGTVDNTAAGTLATLTIGTSLGNGSSTFSGTIQNSGSRAALALVKGNTGTLTLAGANTYTGGTTVNAGTLALGTANNVLMPYTINGGILSVSAASAATSLPMTSLTLSASSPQLTFNFNSVYNLAVPIVNDGGALTINGNVAVNVMNVPQSGSYVLLQYSGARSGSGAFVPGSLPNGATLTDDTAHQRLTLTYVSPLQPTLIVPSLNTNEVVVATTTPQKFGAVGDGITDDSAAFQNAMNAVYNSGGPGGGVVYVPAGFYAFSNNISIPTGVTLHGDWTDWTKGTNGLAGTTFKVYFGAGQTNATSFISMNDSTALRDVNIWYPNQSPTSIVGYPFTIALGNDSVVQNVALVNSYQGIQVNGSAEWILSTVIGSPLYMGFTTEGTIADICHSEDIRFSPAVWPASLLSNSPAVGGSYATWMRTYGTGMQVFRLDGMININTAISGYNIGLDFELNSDGASGSAFYNGYVTNCAIALNAQEMQTAAGLEFSDFTLDGDVAINRTHTTNDAAAQFDNCQIVGRTGTAVYCTGASWQTAMAFQNCAISNTLNLAGPGVFNLVNCSLSGAPQCVISAGATRAAFTGCTFSPAQNIVNNGNATNLLMDARQSISNAMPVVNWTNVINNYVSRQAARTNLFVAANYGATGNGATDDTVAIQNALTAAGANGGGIVYLLPGKYHLTNSLIVPNGTELRGPYEMRHSTGPGADGIAKGAILQPYGGQGTTNGPPAVTLEANAGLVGMTISYESQWTNCFPYPPAIQGRGANVYVIGVQCPNPYIFVDLDTYTCTNHFLDMVDGWALETGVHAGNGSSGSIVDCHANWTYWIDNSDSPSYLQQSVQAPVIAFAMSNLQYYVLGNCTEQFVKDFSIIQNIYMHCSSENGAGPNVTAISAMCDATYQCFVFDSTAPCTFNDVNPEWLVSLNGGYSGLTNQAILISATNFQGTVRIFNSPIWGAHNQDYVVNGGDIGFELVHMNQYAFQGSKANGGVFHLINAGAFNAVDGGNGSSPYFVTFGANPGIAGKTNEVIGCFSYNGWSVETLNVANPDNVWMDYALASSSVLDLGPVIIGDVYPDGAHQFEPSSAITFMAYSPNSINSNGITLQLTATNLLGQGYATNLTAANGLAVTGSSTTKSAGAPLATNAIYTAVIQVIDVNGNRATNTVSFDTINPAYTFEAEDFDFNSGNYIDNPQTNAYAGLNGTAGIDYSNGIPGQGNASYRPQGLETENASDELRLAYSGGLQDYDVGFANTGNWGNYTRAFPVGVYNIYMRAASPNGPTTDSASMSFVTSGGGTINQASNKLGTFSVPNTGNWQAYAWVPLKTNSATFATFTGGAVETLKARTDNGGYNVNFYMLLTTNIPAPWLAVPAPPTAVMAAAGNAQVTLNWTASPAATSYNVARSTANGGTYAMIASNVTAPVYTDAGLNNGITYYYVIASVSALGKGANSTQVGATPVAPIPLAGSLLSNSQFELSWTTNGNGAGWTLNYTSDLTPPITWNPVTNTPVLLGNQWVVTLPIGTNSTGFYQLQQ